MAAGLSPGSLAANVDLAALGTAEIDEILDPKLPSRFVDGGPVAATDTGLGALLLFPCFLQKKYERVFVRKSASALGRLAGRRPAVDAGGRAPRRRTAEERETAATLSRTSGFGIRNGRVTETRHRRQRRHSIPTTRRGKITSPLLTRRRATTPRCGTTGSSSWGNASYRVCREDPNGSPHVPRASRHPGQRLRGYRPPLDDPQSFV